MIVATFHGPNHFRPNHDESTIEVFENIGHAMSTLFDRYDAHGEQAMPVLYLNGGKWRVPFPHIELGDYFECYKVEAKAIHHEYPAIADEQVQEVLTAVHAGLWDYRLKLTAPFGIESNQTDSIAISVEKR